MDQDLKYKFYTLIALLFFGGIMELFGLAMIIPIIKSIIEPNDIFEFINKFQYLEFLKSYDILKLTSIILILTLGIYIFKNFYLLAVGWFQVSFLQNFTNKLTTKVLNNILQKKYRYFTSQNSTNFIKTIANDSVVLRHNLMYCAQIISELFTISLISILLFLTHPLAMVSTVILFFLGSFVFLYLLKRKTKVWANERNFFEKRRLAGVKQIINSIRDLKLLGVERKFIDEFRRDNNFYLNVNKKNELILQVPRLWIEMLTITTVVFLLFVLIFLEDYQILPKSILPILGLYVAASFKLIPSFNRIVVGIQAIRFVAPVLEEYRKLSEINDDEREIYVNSDEDIKFKDRINIKNVNFSYEKNTKKVINDLSIEINVGDKIGIIGESGSGKSTLLDILTGIIEDYSGEVIVDGKNINKGIKSWRKKISYLSQSSVFLNDTLKSNILLGSSNEDESLIQNSILKAEISELINSMPLKENTIVGENAVRLSGGEKQRIALARIFYLKRNFLILDESTNALDEETEKKVISNIFKEFSNSTIIQVSHNTKALNYCNKIYKLSDGKLKLI